MQVPKITLHDFKWKPISDSAADYYWEHNRVVYYGDPVLECRMLGLDAEGTYTCTYDFMILYNKEQNNFVPIHGSVKLPAVTSEQEAKVRLFNWFLKEQIKSHEFYENNHRRGGEMSSSKLVVNYQMKVGALVKNLTRKFETAADMNKFVKTIRNNPNMKLKTNAHYEDYDVELTPREVTIILTIDDGETDIVEIECECGINIEPTEYEDRCLFYQGGVVWDENMRIEPFTYMGQTYTDKENFPPELLHLLDYSKSFSAYGVDKEGLTNAIKENNIKELSRYFEGLVTALFEDEVSGLNITVPSKRYNTRR